MSNPPMFYIKTLNMAIPVSNIRFLQNGEDITTGEDFIKFSSLLKDVKRSIKICLNDNTVYYNIYKDKNTRDYIMRNYSLYDPDLFDN